MVLVDGVDMTSCLFCSVIMSVLHRFQDITVMTKCVCAPCNMNMKPG